MPDLSQRPISFARLLVSLLSACLFGAMLTWRWTRSVAKRASEELKSERDALAQRVADLERSSPVITIRPVLDASDDVLLGYLDLDNEERRYTEHALSQHRLIIAHWYRLLTLFRVAITSIEPAPGGRPNPLDRILRLQFVAAAGGTVKLALDATLAGYYTQAFAMLRHLFETWLRLQYLHARPDMAQAWYVGEQGQSPRPPNEGTIRREVRRMIGDKNKPLVEKVISTIDRLNAMAHPSPHTLQQTVGAHPNQYNVGANYDPDLCASALHEGASGLHLLLETLTRDVSLPNEWQDDFRDAMDRYTSVLAQEVSARETRLRQREAD